MNVTAKDMKTINTTTDPVALARIAGKVATVSALIAWAFGRILHMNDAPERDTLITIAKGEGWAQGQSAGYYSQAFGLYHWHPVLREHAHSILTAPGVGAYALYQAQSHVNKDDARDAAITATKDMTRDELLAYVLKVIADDKDQRKVARANKGQGKDGKDGTTNATGEPSATVTDGTTDAPVLTITGDTLNKLIRLAVASDSSPSEILAALIDGAYDAADIDADTDTDTDTDPSVFDSTPRIRATA